MQKKSWNSNNTNGEMIQFQVNSLCLWLTACVYWVSIKVTMQTISCVCVCRCVYFYACGLRVYVCGYLFFVCMKSVCGFVWVSCVFASCLWWWFETSRFCLIVPQKKKHIWLNMAACPLSTDGPHWAQNQYLFNVRCQSVVIINILDW